MIKYYIYKPNEYREPKYVKVDIKTDTYWVRTQHDEQWKQGKRKFKSTLAGFRKALNEITLEELTIILLK